MMKSPKKKEVRPNPTVLISPLRKHRKPRTKEMEETSDDEVQLCRVRSAEGSPERPSTQRSQTPRMYHQSPQRLSYSSRIPSDASTEPLVPQTPNEGNSISTKRKAEEPLDTVAERAPPKKANTPIDPEALTNALHVSQDVASTASSQPKTEDKPTKDKETTNTPSAPKEREQAENQADTVVVDKPQGSMGPPHQQQAGSKRPSREEEEARIAQEIDHLMKTVKCLPNYYKLVDKIGEGTFSTVYKAQDIRRDYYDNNEWEPQLLESAQNSFVSPSTSQRSTIPETESEAEKEQTANTTLASPPPSTLPKDLSEFVALKRVYDTSSPRRIANEIRILKKLKGSKCISPLITAFRQQDQVFVVMPYIQHDEFKPSFHKMELIDIKYYMKSLFTALQQLHRFKILHRDVKPSNFLYNIRKRAGYLIDFGLAESEDDVMKLERQVKEAAKMSKFSVYPQAHNDNNNSNSSSNSANASKQGATKMASSNSVLAALTNKAISASTSANATSTNISSNTPSTTPFASRNSNKGVKGVYRNDPRLTIRANRAGTRGFRAPEILMRVTHQTCAIDIWAAGVILLCFLTNTYPFFLSNDEADALIELSHVYGTEKMQECAKINNRHFETNIYLPKAKLPWLHLIQVLNKEKMQAWPQKDLDDAVMLLRRAMELDPNKRITAEEALKMDFLQVE
ncbi:Ser/Thr protein kinase [Mucor ambiguus]|uniref:non-specific serine/threonine protein kinase n=1 Tax=Mucor ambiguus TaxID=91626 RepID=A0A0C9LTG8_9FUNG|nr:Ser/Thr protein kinase [Mucor ambiguus]